MRISQALQAVADRQKRQEAALRRNEAIIRDIEAKADTGAIARRHGVSTLYVSRVEACQMDRPMRGHQKVFKRVRSNIPGLNERQSKLLSFLAHIEVSGGAMPSRKYIMRATGYTSRMISMASKELEEKGLIERVLYNPRLTKLTDAGKVLANC